ncbi:MAG: TIR domain-containing protein [Hyphomicrobiales bacterium]
MMERIRAFLDRLYGYDYFISYAHAGGLDYPDALKEKLEELAFSVFIDREAFKVGSSLTTESIRCLKSSTKLVLVGSAQSFESVWVQKEVEIANAQKKPVVLININSAFERSEGSNKLKQLLHDNIQIQENTENLDDLDKPIVEPSANTIQELSRSFSLLKREKLRQRVFAVALIFIALFSMLLGGIAEWQRRDAEARKQEAQIAQSRFLASLANEMTASGDAGTAAKISLQALFDEAPGRSRPDVFQARASLYRALNRLKLQADYDNIITWPPPIAGVSSRYALWVDYADQTLNGLYRLGLTSGEKIALNLKLIGLTRVALSHDGEWALVSYFDGPIALYSFAEGKVVTHYGEAGDQPLPYSLIGFEGPDKNLIPATREGLGFVLLKPGGRAPLYAESDALRLPMGVSRAADNSSYVVRKGNGLFDHVDGTSGGVGFSFRAKDPDFQMSSDGLLQSEGTFRAQSPDGRYFVIGHNGGAYVWDLEAKKMVGNVTGSLMSDIIVQAVFSNDGSRMALSALSGRVWLWDLEEHDLLYKHSVSSNQLERSTDVALIEFSDDGKILRWLDASGQYRTLRQKEDERFFVLALSQADFEVSALDTGMGTSVSTFAVSEKLNILVLGNNKGAVQIIQRGDGDRVFWLAGHSREIDQLVILEKQKLLISRARNEVKIWTLGPQIPHIRLHLGGETSPFVLIQDDRKSFFTKRGPRIEEFDIASGKRQKVLEGNGSDILDLIQTDADTLFSAHEDGTVLAWDTVGGTHHTVLPVGEPVFGLISSQQSKFLLVQASNHDLRAIAKENGAELFVLPGTELAEMEIVAENRRILTYGLGHDVKLWNAMNGRPVHTFSESRHWKVFWDTDKKRLFVPSQNEVSIYDLGTGAKLQSFTVDALSRNDFQQSIVSVWPTSTVGRFYLILQNGEAIAYEPEAEELIFRHKAERGSYLSVVELPTLNALALSSDTGELTILAADKGLVIDVLPAHGAVSYPALPVGQNWVTGRGAILVTRGADATIRIWHLQPFDRDAMASRFNEIGLPALTVQQQCRFFIKTDTSCDPLSLNLQNPRIRLGIIEVRLPRKYTKLE